MTIKLDKRFTITSDSTSFSLNYTPDKKEDSKKEPTSRAVGHYGDLPSALKGYLKNAMRSEEIDLEVIRVIDYIKYIEINIYNAIKETK